MAEHLVARSFAVVDSSDDDNGACEKNDEIVFEAVNQDVNNSAELLNQGLPH